MQAEFSTAAVKAFETSYHGQRITYKTVGGILHVKKFALHLKLSPSAHHKAFLLIENCQYLGSGGASIVEQLQCFPALDGVRHKLPNLFHALNVGRMGQLDNGSNVSQVVRSRESRAVPVQDLMDAYPDTQHSFSTQRVPSRSEISGISERHPSSAHSSHESGEVLDSIQRNFDPPLMPSISRDKTLLLDLLHKHTRAVPEEPQLPAKSFKTTHLRAEMSRGSVIRSFKSDELGNSTPVKRGIELQSKGAVPAQATPSANNLIMSPRGEGEVRARIFRNQDRLSAGHTTRMIPRQIVEGVHGQVNTVPFGTEPIKNQTKGFQNEDAGSKGRTAKIAEKGVNQSIQNEVEAPTPDSAMAGCAVTWDVPDPWQVTVTQLTRLAPSQLIISSRVVPRSVKGI